MKRIFAISIITGAVTVGLLYFFYHTNKNNIEAVVLDFAEYSLGGI